MQGTAYQGRVVINPGLSFPGTVLLRERGKVLGAEGNILGPSRRWGSYGFSCLSPYHVGPPIVTPGLVEVDGVAIQGPDEGEVHGGVVGGMALQRQAVSQVDVGTRGG